MEQTTFGWRAVNVTYKSTFGVRTFEFLNDRGYAAPPVPPCEDARAGEPDLNGFVRHVGPDGVINGDSTQQSGWSNTRSFCFGVVGRSLEIVDGREQPTDNGEGFTTFGVGKDVDRSTMGVMGYASSGQTMGQSLIQMKRSGDKMGTSLVLELTFDGTRAREYLQGTNGLPADAEWTSFEWTGLTLKYAPDGQIFEWDRNSLK